MRLGDAPDRSLLDRIETASRDEIISLQTRRVAATLRRSYDAVPPIRAKFDEHGVHPDDFRELEDLKRFPFTVKSDLRANYPFGLFAVPKQELARIHASSGTTGKPTVVGYTRNDLAMWGEVMARTIRAAGGRKGMMAHNAYGYGLFTGGLGYHYGAERLGCALVPVSGGMTERQVQLINDFAPGILFATPSYALRLVDEFRAQGLDPRRSSLKLGSFGAEPWTNAMRSELEDAFDMDALDSYGLSEVIGPGVAGECVETKDGLHIWEDHFYPEIIDPVTGAVLADGEKGEIVFTSLTKEAMPVVRYRTGDLTRLLPGTARSTRRMEKVSGRTDDMMIVRGVNVFPTQIEELILGVSGLSPHYQLILTREGRLDDLEVQVEARTQSDSYEARDHAGGALAHAMKAHVGISARVSVLAPGQIERSLGKAKRVIDKRPKA
ncbi:MAG: phenylacetate--CoA ligase [Hyphomicrobiales bacterium]|nr:phenylacetate--CoA ligase [Hyphomicrobiales bacterium]